MQVAELGSLTRTAERLRIAQPSLSRQMRLLEEELGVTLFTRGHRGMQLTEAGEALRTRIAGPLRQIGHALYEIRALPTETVGNVAFGMPPSFVPVLAQRLSRQIAVQAPQISLHIVEGYSGHLLDWMKKGELDVAIIYGPTPGGVNATRLLDDELVLVSSAKRDMPSDAIDFRTLGDFPLVLPSQSHGLRTAIEIAASKARTKLNVPFQSDSFQLMLELVASGEYCTILPPCAVQRQVAEGQFRTFRIQNPAPKRQLYVAMQSGAQSPRAVLKVEHLLREEVAQLVQEGAFTSARALGIADL